MIHKGKTRLSAQRWAGSASAFLLAGAALLLAAPAAYANSAANIDGARATFQSGTGGVFQLFDTKCDSHPVFLDYTVEGRRSRIDFSGGCGKSGTYNLRLPRGKHVTYKACVNIQHGFDRCSGKSDDIS